jgi:hypothetical protein
MNPLRATSCPRFKAIGPVYGFCCEHERHVSLDHVHACLCDHCTTGSEGLRHISKDVFFHGHDLVGLRSDKQATFDRAVIVAATTPCAPRMPIPALAPATKPRPKAQPAPAKRAPSLLDYS